MAIKFIVVLECFEENLLRIHIFKKSYIRIDIPSPTFLTTVRANAIVKMLGTWAAYCNSVHQSVACSYFEGRLWHGNYGRLVPKCDTGSQANAAGLCPSWPSFPSHENIHHKEKNVTNQSFEIARKERKSVL